MTKSIVLFRDMTSYIKYSVIYTAISYRICPFKAIEEMVIISTNYVSK